MAQDTGDGAPAYLDLEDALGLYAVIIDATVEQAADHLRDRGGLEGALGRPRSYADYQSADLALQAAVLAHGIAESQTFIDGNKRLAPLLFWTRVRPDLQRPSEVPDLRASAQA